MLRCVVTRGGLCVTLAKESITLDVRKDGREAGMSNLAEFTFSARVESLEQKQSLSVTLSSITVLYLGNLETRICKSVQPVILSHCEHTVYNDVAKNRQQFDGQNTS